MHPIEPEELMAYLDGELEPQRASEAAQHLSHCAECQKVAGEIQGVSRRLSEWHVDQPGARMKQAIIAAAEKASRNKRSFGNWRVPWVLGSASASVLACALLAVLFAPRYHMAKQRTSIAAKIEPGSLPDSRGRLPHSALSRAAPEGDSSFGAAPAAPAPLVVRTAQFTLTAADVAAARARLEDILKRCAGHIGELTGKFAGGFWTGLCR